MSDKKYIKMAEKEVLRLAREVDLAMKLMDGLSCFGHAVTHDWVGRKAFFAGLEQMRDGLYREYMHAISKACAFSWVPDSAAQAFAKRLMSDRFSPTERYDVMSFLQNWCQLPGAYSGDEEADFRAEVKEVLEEDKP
jgi:hypothetical protein